MFGATHAVFTGTFRSVCSCSRSTCILKQLFISIAMPCSLGLLVGRASAAIAQSNMATHRKSTGTSAGLGGYEGKSAGDLKVAFQCAQRAYFNAVATLPPNHPLLIPLCVHAHMCLRLLLAACSRSLATKTGVAAATLATETKATKSTETNLCNASTLARIQHLSRSYYACALRMHGVCYGSEERAFRQAYAREVNA
jgi:hypothetical protein